MKLNAMGGSFSGGVECHGVLWGVSWGEVSRDAVGCGGRCASVSRGAMGCELG